MKWWFIVILICISLIASGSEHLFNVHWTSIFHLLWNACLWLLASLYFLIFICVSSLSGCTYYSHFMAFPCFYDVFWWVEVFNFNLIILSNHFICDFHFVCLKGLHSSDIIKPSPICASKLFIFFVFALNLQFTCNCYLCEVRKHIHLFIWKAIV